MSTGSAPSCGAASRTGTTDPDGGDAFIGQVVLNGIDNRPKVGLFEGGGTTTSTLTSLSRLVTVQSDLAKDRLLRLSYPRVEASNLDHAR